MTAEQFYQQGNRYRKQGLWHEAINAYTEAVARDPESPAAEARQMLLDIMNYYNKDLYNP
jgi:outer membrane protein assembly factor BamD (BamD/ComL family)